MKRPLTFVLAAIIAATTASQALALNPQPLPPRRIPILLRAHRLFPPHHRHHHHHGGGHVAHAVFVTRTGGGHGK